MTNTTQHTPGPIESLTQAIKDVERDYPLPRCPHGATLKDGAGDILEPSCGCRFGDLRWIKARTVLHLHDDKGGTGISAPIPSGPGAVHPNEKNPRLQTILDLIAAAPETARERDALKAEVERLEKEMDFQNDLTSREHRYRLAAEDGRAEHKARAEKAETRCGELLAALNALCRNPVVAGQAAGIRDNDFKNGKPNSWELARDAIASAEAA